MFRVFLISISVFLIAAKQPVQKKKVETEELLKILIKNQLAEKHHGARIDLDSKFVWTRGSIPSKITQLRFENSSPRGIARFKINDSEVRVKYSAWKLAPIAKRRIRPGEALNRTDFRFEEVDLARGLARSHQGMILSPDSRFKELESRATILAGQYPLLSSVRTIPIVRRGDFVRLYIRSNGLTVTTIGKAQQSGQVGKQIRVLTKKTKRELVGKILSNGQVEVHL